MGLELSGPSAARIRATLGVPVHEAAIEEAPLEPGSAGLVTFSHSLEHVLDPVGALRRAAELVRPGGHVHVAVPNWSATKRVVAGAHIPWIYPHHVSYFARPTLERALRSAGLEPVRWSVHPFIGLDYPFALGVLRRLGLEPLVRRFLRMGERPLEELIANDVAVACPPWRFRMVVGLTNGLLRAWPEGALCRLGRGEELRGTAVRAG